MKAELVRIMTEEEQKFIQNRLSLMWKGDTFKGILIMIVSCSAFKFSISRDRAIELFFNPASVPVVVCHSMSVGWCI